MQKAPKPRPTLSPAPAPAPADTEAPRGGKRAAGGRVDEAYEGILRIIKDAGLFEGAKLPSETEMSTLFGISRPVVRQALSRLQQAISCKTGIEIDYTNTKSEITRREVEAIGLVFYALSWHLIGWCHLRGEYRDFRVSRILKLRETGLPFKKTDHMEVNEYMKLLPVQY